MATRNISYKVVNARKVSFALLACDLSIGFTDDNGKYTELFVIPDFFLKKSANSGNYYFQGPSKPYMKDGVHQVDDNGYKRYIEFFRIASEKNGDGKTTFTKAGATARKEVIDLMVAAMNEVGTGSSSGGSRPTATRTPTQTRTPARATRPAAAKTQIEEDEVSVGVEEDDEIPF